MPTLDEGLDAVRHAIADRFSAGGRGRPDAVAFEFGTPVPIQSFASAETGDYSASRAIEFLSTAANVVPNLSGDVFERSLRTVDGQYEVLLRGARPLEASDAELFDAIKGRAVAAFERDRGSLIGPHHFHPAYGSPTDWFDPRVESNWTSFAFTAEDRVSEPPVGDGRLRSWRILPAPFREIVEDPFSREAIDRAATQVAATQAAERARILTEDDPYERRENGGNIRYTRRRHDPVQWIRASATHPLAIAVDEGIRHVALQRAGNANGHGNGSPDPRTQIVDAVALPWVIARAVKEQSESRPVTTERMSLTFDICLVALNRPWLSDGFLSLVNWYVPHYAEGAFSDGTPEYDGGALAAIPTACVLIRNLTIAAQWSADDRAAVESSAGLGPFSLLGRTYDVSTGTVTVPGVQIIAWVCEAMPLLPPRSDPSHT
jgi:hypothetical protein